MRKLLLVSARVRIVVTKRMMMTTVVVRRNEPYSLVNPARIMYTIRVFETPGKKKKKQSSSTSCTATMKKSSTTTSAKKRKEQEKQELKTTMKYLLENPTNICIRYCVDDPKQPARKPRWGDCDGAYKKYFDWNLYTSNKDPDPYTHVLNHFKKEMDDNIDCITKLMEYNHSYFFYDPYTKSSP